MFFKWNIIMRVEISPPKNFRCNSNGASALCSWEHPMIECASYATTIYHIRLELQHCEENDCSYSFNGSYFTSIVLTYIYLFSVHSAF